MNDRTELFRVYVGNKTDIAYNDVYDSLQKFDAARTGLPVRRCEPRCGAQLERVAGEPHRLRAAAVHRRGVGPRDERGAHARSRSASSRRPPGTTPTPWLTEDGFVTFETTTDFADAEYVSVWANWAPGGSWLRVEMNKVGDRWRATVGPLEEKFYHYRLIVDRQSVKDTSNPTKVTSEPAWSTFLVPGEGSRLLADVPAGQGGDLEVMTYQSTVAGQERSAYVWTPPGYDPDRAEPYPLFVLNHGGGQSWTDWVEVGRARQILDNLSLDGAIEPMVVVMPNGNVSNYPRELLENVVPVTEERYNVSSDPAERALAGLSAGGARTVSVLKAHPGEFAWIGTFAAGFGGTAGVDAAAINAGTELYRIYTGDITDFTYGSVMSSLPVLDQLGIEYEFDGVTVGPHGWDVWQKNLIDLRPASVPGPERVSRAAGGDTAAGCAPEAAVIRMPRPRGIADRAV